MCPRRDLGHSPRKQRSENPWYYRGCGQDLLAVEDCSRQGPSQKVVSWSAPCVALSTISHDGAVITYKSFGYKHTPFVVGPNGCRSAPARQRVPIAGDTSISLTRACKSVD